MDGERRDNSGALFINNRKEKENHPDRQGQIMVEGVEYWLSGWCKVSKAGEKYISLSVKRKEPKPSAGIAEGPQTNDPSDGW